MVRKVSAARENEHITAACPLLLDQQSSVELYQQLATGSRTPTHPSAAKILQERMHVIDDRPRNLVKNNSREGKSHEKICVFSGGSYADGACKGR